ncbi:tRNA dimethylallyltransferase, mitochondrial [Didymosphaeria variabile]|uniref:tRNA dimethylallyltransferase n=1 Tax=Didymosphaeria variabile TaxID=1932322 RepID=A0A9W8XJP0_9PLEO|nr:tRNA dimethylallyltransferase, mitochondrial [Didymosphaeria variabile]KAJ4351378.1 tRNA dimethylallyltransferase, mitochondrial [Didymosphaeria variabile]
MAVTPPSKPLVAIVGATGTGKSDLAVELAQRFNGEVINGDAMQLYKGLPIITNKITEDEMKGVSHHLLGRIGLEEETWTVGKFVANALGVIDEIRSRGKLPILVGGTHYYTQSLLFKDALSEEPLLKIDENQSERLPVLDEPTEVLLKRLREVDPVMADRWHPNERRKIQRSLEIFLKTGKPASQVYSEQQSKKGLSADESGNTSSLRFPTLLFWVHASKEVLTTRLDARVDKMLEKGLLSEVETLHNFRSDFEARTGQEIDQTRGIWVSIGYKEFMAYQTALCEGSHSEAELAKLKQAAIEKTQAATRQYAKRQVRWIQIKLLNALLAAGQGGNTFLLDLPDVSKWEAAAVRPSTDITERFLLGQSLPDPASLSEAARDMLNPKRDYDLSQRPDLWGKRVCETCGTTSFNENDWKLHLKSRSHRRAVGTNKKKANVPSARFRGPTAAQEDMIDVLESSMSTFPNES